MSLNNLARAHDELAPVYDSLLAQNAVAEWMRGVLWVHLTRVFPPRARLLDFTAGTGADALFLAERGAAVVAADISPGMIAELERKARQRGLPIETRVLAAEQLSELDASDFDGALSTFAGLNTIDDLPRLARDLAARLKPRGRVILHALNQFCLWETANNLLHGRLIRERITRTRIGSQEIAHRFYNPFALARDSFAPYFILRGAYALSVLAAPPLIRRVPTFAPILFTIDRVVGRVLPAAGDFFVMDLEKRSLDLRTSSSPSIRQ